MMKKKKKKKKNQFEINELELLCRIDTSKELEYYKAGGILQYVLNTIIAKN